MREGGKWTVLSLDPSINDCGFCGWNGNKPAEYGLLHPPRRLRDWRQKAASIRDKVQALVRIHDPLFVVAESPETIYEGKKWDKKPPDGTLRLAYLLGMLADSIHVPPALPRFFLEVPPRTWKGTSPKTANLRFVNHVYGVGLTNDKKSLDIADSVGIGHWFRTMASPEMLGKTIYAPCSEQKLKLLAAALARKGWRT